ncbi:hypothetical protein K443DRAFT_675276 [Laccaria amethystina LaAM-08-1]|uniref:Secreted protein n=1 Tax=Laccaria amethystina LaAM-08-1 TaxID=1095629 RepID=A0A0C9YB54_9AGAR|nr:hypothetical protein K443DRAFT_675276 [Laccaria amethystina LaAM-08-1]
MRFILTPLWLLLCLTTVAYGLVVRSALPSPSVRSAPSPSSKAGGRRNALPRSPRQRFARQSEATELETRNQLGAAKRNKRSVQA